MGNSYSLVGVDGNAYSVMTYVSKAMRKSGKSGVEIQEFIDRATRGDYDTLLAECQDMVDVLNDGE